MVAAWLPLPSSCLTTKAYPQVMEAILATVTLQCWAWDECKMIACQLLPIIASSLPCLLPGPFHQRKSQPKFKPKVWCILFWLTLSFWHKSEHLQGGRTPWLTDSVTRISAKTCCPTTILKQAMFKKKSAAYLLVSQLEEKSNIVRWWPELKGEE